MANTRNFIVFFLVWSYVLWFSDDISFSKSNTVVNVVVLLNHYLDKQKLIMKDRTSQSVTTMANSSRLNVYELSIFSYI